MAVNVQSDLLPRPPHNITGLDAGIPYGTEHSVIGENSVSKLVRFLQALVFVGM